MSLTDNEMRKTTNEKRNITTKSTKNLNAWRKRNLQVLGNIGVNIIIQVVMKEKLKKKKKKMKNDISGKRENYLQPNYI